MKKQIFASRVFAITLILFVLLQSFLLPIGLAVNGWTGNSWSGNSWDGNSWEGTTWEGNEWHGKAWEGTTWDGSNGSGTAPGGTNPGAGLGGNPPSTNPGNGPGTSPGGTVPTIPGTMPGLPGIQLPGTQLPGTQPTIPGLPGIVTPPNEKTDPSSTENDKKDVDGYAVTKYVVNDVINGQVKFAVKVTKAGADFNPGSYMAKPNMFSTLLLNGAKLGLGDNAPGWFTAVDQTHGAVQKGVTVYDSVKAFRDGKNIANAAGGATGQAVRLGAEASGAVTKFGALAKFNVATASVGTVFSAIDTGKSAANAYNVLNSDASGAQKTSAVADTTSKFGELLMNGGAVAAAIPGGQAIGTAMVVGGAAIWGVSKVVKAVADNWDSIKKAASTVKSAVKSVGKGLVNMAKGWLGG